MEFPRYARCQIEWKIQNINSQILSRPSFPNVYSQIFTIHLKNSSWCQATTKWKLCAYRNRSSLSLYLQSSDKYGTDASYKDYYNLLIKYEMKLKEIYGGFVSKQQGVIDGFGYEKRLGKITSITDLNKRSSYRVLKDNSLQLIISFDIIEKNVESAAKIIANNSLLSTSFETMYNNEKYSDYTLITADGDPIPVHKNILASRSQVFATMMENKEFIEGEQKKALIDDIDSKALREFLRFLYCGRVNEIENVAVDLIYAAEKYGLKDLKPLCVRAMIKSITCDNAIDTLILADLHQEKALKQFTLDFIMWNYEKLKDQESWNKLTNTLYKDILDFAVKMDKSSRIVRLSTTINIVTQTQPTVAAAAVQNQQAAIRRMVDALNNAVIVPRAGNANANAQAAQPAPVHANAQPAANGNAQPRVANAAVP